MNRKILLIGAAVVAVVVIIIYVVSRGPGELVLTGIVTTNDVIVSPQVSGQVSRLLVEEGDSVAQDQLLAVLSPAELEADQTYFAHSAQAMASQVRQSEADLRFQETQASEQVREAVAMLAAAIAQAAQDSATMINARRVYERYGPLLEAGAVSTQQVDSARTGYTVAQARSEASSRQVEAQRAAVALARANEDQVAGKRSALGAARQTQAAAAAQIVQLIGLPEGLYPLSQATIYLARAPKSNAIKAGYFAAAEDAAQTAREPVPFHLRNAVTNLMKAAGYGEGYRYVHSDAAAKDEMECLPETLRGRRYLPS